MIDIEDIIGAPAWSVVARGESDRARFTLVVNQFDQWCVLQVWYPHAGYRDQYLHRGDGGERMARERFDRWAIYNVTTH